jgi:hypothetical protein
VVGEHAVVAQLAHFEVLRGGLFHFRPHLEHLEKEVPTAVYHPQTSLPQLLLNTTGGGQEGVRRGSGGGQEGVRFFFFFFLAAFNN